MKIATTFRTLAAAIALVAPAAIAQELVTQTTTSGTITRFTPEAIIVDSGTSPITYTATSATQYVDEAGTPVGVEVVKSGVPVVVQYVKEGGTMVARKVIVKKTVTTSVPGSTSMTTTVQPVEAIGTVSQVSPNAVVVQSTAGTPVTYSYTNATQYVDAAGNPVTVETVRSGAPVTVSYVQEGDRMIARRVVVRTTEAAPATTVKKTVTTTTTKSSDDDDDDDND